MEENYCPEEECDNFSLHKSQDEWFSDRLRDICQEYTKRIEYKAEKEKNWHAFDHLLTVSIAPEAYLVVQDLAEMTGRNEKEITRELLEDGIRSLIARLTKHPEDVEDR